MSCINPFDLQTYLYDLEIKIHYIFSRPCQQQITFDILDNDYMIQMKKLVLKEKQRQMKIGEIWQEVLGSYQGFINLKTRTFKRT